MHHPRDVLCLLAAFDPGVARLGSADKARWASLGEHFWRAVLKTCLLNARRWRWMGLFPVFGRTIPGTLVARFPALGAVTPHFAPQLPCFDPAPSALPAKMQKDWNSFCTQTRYDYPPYLLRAGVDEIISVNNDGRDKWSFLVNGKERVCSGHMPLVAASRRFFVFTQRSRHKPVFVRYREEPWLIHYPVAMLAEPRTTCIVREQFLVAYSAVMKEIEVFDVTKSDCPVVASLAVPGYVMRLLLVGDVLVVADRGVRDMNTLFLFCTRTWCLLREVKVPVITRIETVGNDVSINQALRLTIVTP